MAMRRKPDFLALQPHSLFCAPQAAPHLLIRGRAEQGQLRLGPVAGVWIRDAHPLPLLAHRVSWPPHLRGDLLVWHLAEEGDLLG
jgi:hypothetical protein